MTLKELREKLASLQAESRSLVARLKDETPEAEARKIDAENSAKQAEIAEIREKISEIEAAERAAVAIAAEPPAIAEAVATALATERKRAAEIRTIARRHNVDSALVDKAIDENVSVPEFRKQVLETLADAPANQRGAGPATVSVLIDEGETRRSAMVDALAARLARAGGDRGVAIPDHARQYAEMGLVEIAAECIGHRGMLRTGRQAADVLDRAFAARGFVGATATDFPGIMLDAMNKRLLSRYQAAAPAYRRFAAPYTAADFRSQNVVRAGDFPALQPVGENGEIKAGSFSESKETFKVNPYAVRLNISRVMIVNDNLAAIDQVLSSSGVRVSDWENAIAFGVLLAASGAGPTLATDNMAVFAAGHSNLAGSGTVIDVANVGIGRAAMMKQTTLDGIKANFVPVTLLTGPDKQTQAEQLLTTITPAVSANAVPESLRRLSPVADANISGNAWYLFADPAIAPCFVYGYLEGFEGPRLTSEAEFSVQGLSTKLEHDFGVSAIDYRGGYRNPGA